MNKPSWKSVAIFGGIAIGLLWILAPLAAIAFARTIDGGQTSLGATGDIFGLMSALFNGFAFLALIVVLVYEMGERKTDLANAQRQLRPFVVPQLSDAGVKLRRAEWDGTELVWELTAEFRVANVTPDVAMNVAATSALTCDSRATLNSQPAQVVLDLPIVGEGDEIVKCTFSAREDAGSPLMRALATRTPVALSVEVTYEALNGVKWASSVQYSLQLDSDGPDRAGKILSKQDEYYIKLGASGRPVTFDSTVDPGSWSQDER